MYFPTSLSSPSIVSIVRSPYLSDIYDAHILVEVEGKGGGGSFSLISCTSTKTTVSYIVAHLTIFFYRWDRYVLFFHLLVCFVFHSFSSSFFFKKKKKKLPS